MATIAITGRSARGRRDSNEDGYLVRQYTRATREDPFGRALIIIADGMGGHAAGEIASATAIEAARRSYEASREVEEIPRLHAAVVDANHAVYKRAGEELMLRGMGTTLIALAIAGREAALVHVGDSRCYHLSGGKLSQVTRDHTIFPGSSVLTACVGTRDELEAADPVSLQLAAGDALLLCTDGVPEKLDLAALEALLIQPETTGRRIVDRAIAAGSRDNCTAVLVRI